MMGQQTTRHWESGSGGASGNGPRPHLAFRLLVSRAARQASVLKPGSLWLFVMTVWRKPAQLTTHLSKVSRFLIPELRCWRRAEGHVYSF